MVTERRELDPTFKQIVTQFLEPLPVIVQTEVEVSHLPRTIDVLVLVESAEAHTQLRAQTPFHHFRRHNQIEFKGKRDRLTLWNYLNILGRAHFYMGENKIPLDEMSITIVCAGKPRKVLENTLLPHTFTESEAGWYQRVGFPQVTIIVINELPATAENYLLLIFAGSERKFRQFFQQVLEERQFDYLPYAYQVRPQITKELLLMAGVYSIPRENLEFIAQDIGEELIEFISPKLRLRGMSVQDRLAGIAPADRLAGITPQDRLVGVAPDQIVQTVSFDELQALIQKATEEARRRVIDETSSAKTRIAALRKLSEDNRTFLLDEAQRERLLQGLSQDEQAKLLRWIVDQA